MTNWDINPATVNQVLAETSGAADGIATALGGAADGASMGVGSVGLGACSKAQSNLIATAIQSYFDDRKASISQTMYRIVGVMNATVDACNAVGEGHEQMAQDIQTRIASACESGDFTSLLPDR